MKFTTFIDESIGKINQFPAHRGWGGGGDLKSYLNLQEKDC